jgi:hypothetical protein
MREIRAIPPLGAGIRGCVPPPPAAPYSRRLSESWYQLTLQGVTKCSRQLWLRPLWTASRTRLISSRSFLPRIIKWMEVVLCTRGLSKFQAELICSRTQVHPLLRLKAAPRRLVVLETTRLQVLSGTVVRRLILPQTHQTLLPSPELNSGRALGTRNSNGIPW